MQGSPVTYRNEACPHWCGVCAKRVLLVATLNCEAWRATLLATLAQGHLVDYAHPEWITLAQPDLVIHSNMSRCWIRSFLLLVAWEQRGVVVLNPTRVTVRRS